MARTMDLTEVKNPFSKLTPEDYAKHAGEVVAVDKESGLIVASALTAKLLREEMAKKPEIVKWARIAIPAKTK